MKRLIMLLLVLVIAGAGIQECAAEEGWEFSLSPYVWLVGINGDIGPKANPASVDVQFTDLLDRVDWGFVGAFEGRYDGKWIAIVEGIYAELDESGIAPSGGPDRITSVGGPLDVEMDMSLGTVFAGVRTGDKVTVDYLVGARWLYTKSYLRFPKAVTRKQDWVDPVVGVRVSGRVKGRLGAALEADIGGFGVGSELVWQVLPAVTYQFSDTISTRLGYRLLDIDYEENSYALDAQFHGWFIGAAMQY